MDAVLKADDAANKARKDFYNFDLIDSVEIDDESIKEGVPINAIKETEKDLDIELFKKWSRQIFGCVKIGKDEQLKVIRNFISDDLYDKFIFQMKQFEKDGLEFVTEDLLIKDCKIYDYRKSLNKEEIIVYIDSKMKEYIIRKSDNEIIKGNKDRFYNKKILMTFEKKQKPEKEGIIHNCPNCGGTLDQPEFGKCRYCSTLIFPIRYNWTLTKFEFLDLIEYEGEEYVILLPASEVTDEPGEVVILKVEDTESEDEESYVSVDDENVLNAVFEIFKEKFKDEFNFED